MRLTASALGCQPHEVLVLCPDLSRFAPLIDAVFGRGGLPVPVRVSDRSLTSDQPLVVALQAVVGVASGRASLSEVLAFAELEPVRRRFGWSPADVEQLAGWAATLGARWGLTSDLRAEWGAAAEHAAPEHEFGHADAGQREFARDIAERHRQIGDVDEQDAAQCVARIVTQHHARADDAVGSDPRAGADLGPGLDNRGGVDNGR